MNGSVVVADPQTGRILTVVNQQVAFREAYTPCSTIKIFVGLAGLSEGLIERTTDGPVRSLRCIPSRMKSMRVSSAWKQSFDGSSIS